MALQDPSNSDIAAQNPLQPTTSSLPDQVQERTIDSQPSAQPAQAPQPPAAQPAQAAQPGAAPTAAPQVPAVRRRSLFDHVLQGLAGGPTRVTDPNTGVTSELPMTKKSLTAHILAGALTGIISNAQGQDQVGPAGTRTPGNMAALSGGFGATQQKLQDIRNAPQAAIDQATLNKQRAMANTLYEMQNQIAVGKLHEEAWENAEAHYTKAQDIFRPVLENVEAADNALGKDEPSLFVDGARKLSHEDAMQKMQGHHGEYQPIQDGWTTETDPTGRTMHVPTFSLVRNSGTVNVNRETLGSLAQYNGDIANLLAKSSVDNVPMSTSQLLNLEKDAHQGLITEGWINDIRAGLDKQHEDDEDWKPLGKVQGFNSAYRDDPSVHSQVDQMMSDLGSYGTHSTASTLDELMKGNKGGALMKFFGTDKDTLSKFVQDKMVESQTATSLSKSAGQIKIAELKTSNKPLDHKTAISIQAAAAAGQPVAPVDLARAKSFTNIEESIDSRKKRTAALDAQAVRAGNTDEAAQMLYDGTTTLSELKVRGLDESTLTKIIGGAKQLALNHGEKGWTPQTTEGFFKAASSPENSKFFGSANSLLDPEVGTFAVLQSEYDKLGNGQIPLLNKWEDYAAYQLGLSKKGDAAAAMMQAAIGVADDYGKVMGGGVGTDLSRSQILESMGVMKEFSNAHNPQQMQAVLDTAKRAVKSQVGGRIGQNPIMFQMYGQNVPEHAKDIKALQKLNASTTPTQQAPPARPAGTVGTRQDASGNHWYVDAQGKALGMSKE